MKYDIFLNVSNCVRLNSFVVLLTDQRYDWDCHLQVTATQELHNQFSN